jgi:hypothetical protein
MAACTTQDGEDVISYPESTIAVEEAFFGQTGTAVQGKLYGVDIVYQNFGEDNVYEGDILLTEEQLSATSAPEGKTQGTGRTRLAARWPNRIVYYTVDAALPNKQRVTQAIQHWESNTAIRFVQRTTQPNYINFVVGSGCSSSVGMTGRRQTINLASGCTTGNTIHEIGHALGLWHEQSRVDRGNYLRINFENIQDGLSHNFDTYAAQGSDGFDFTGGLDFGSIMMYGPFSFSKNGLPTIVKLDGSTYAVQRNALSPRDIGTINFMYP